MILVRRWLASAWPFLVFSGILLVQVINNSIPGDLQVFHRARLDVREGTNPWLPSGDSTNFQYLYGPINAVICTVLSYLGERGMYLLICVTAITLAPLTIYIFSELLGERISSRGIFLLSTIFIASFPFRANLQYGQFVVHYTFILLSTIYILLHKNQQTGYSIALGLTPVLLLEFKPHLFFPFIIFWFFHFKRDKFFRLGVFIGLLIEFFLLYLLTGTALPIEWISRIVGRGVESDGLAGYYNISNLMAILGISGLGTIVTATAILLFLVLVLIRRSPDVVFFLVFLYLAIFPAFHPQDFLILLLLFILTSLNTLRSWQMGSILGMGIFWSSNEYLAVFATLMIVVSIFNYFGFGEWSFRNYVKNVVLLLLPLLFVTFGSYDVDDFRIIVNCLSVLSIFVWLVTGAKKIRRLNILQLE